MRFGSSYHIKSDPKNNLLQVRVQKIRDYNEYVNEIIKEERVQIMKIQDFDTLINKLHVEHPMKEHGGWIEYRQGKMYAVLTWVEPVVDK